MEKLKELIKNRVHKFKPNLKLERYQFLTAEQRIEEILNIQDTLAQNPNNKDELYFNLALLLQISQEYNDAIASYDKVLEIKPDDDQALEFNPDLILI